MAAYHKRYKGLATLAVKTRKATRYLLFDDEYHLIGWKSNETGEQKIVRRNVKLSAFFLYGYSCNFSGNI